MKETDKNDTAVESGERPGDAASALQTTPAAPGHLPSTAEEPQPPDALHLQGTGEVRHGPVRRFITFTGKLLAPLAVLGLGFYAFNELKASKPPAVQLAERTKIWPVTAVPVAFADYSPDLKLFGQTSSGRRVELRALVGGQVTDVGEGLRNGAQVARGDQLLTIDSFEYEGALEEAGARLAEARARYREIEATMEAEQDALRRAKEQLEIAKRDLERAIPLAKRGTVTKKTADDRRLAVSEREQAAEQRANNLAIQQARLEQQRATIAQQDWRRRQAERNLKDTKLVAPFDAYVADVRAERGRLIGVNDQVATLLDRNWVDVRFTLSDKQFGRIVAKAGTVVGRPVRILWRVGNEPLVYSGKIERVAAEISSQSGGVEVFARFDDPTKPVPIRAGAFVEIELADRTYEKVARLPQTALYGSDKVYVIEDGKLKARKVELVGAAGADILVRGQIAKDDKVLTTRLSMARDGLTVEVR